MIIGICLILNDKSEVSFPLFFFNVYWHLKINVQICNELLFY